MPLNLDPRQRAMLAEMGIRVWAPTPAAEAVPAPVPTTAPAPALAPATPAARQATPQAPRPITVAAPVAAPTPAPVAEPEPPPIDVSQLDWPALQSAVADCRACGLCDSRTQTVFGAGSTQAPWLVVGEAPGEAEDRQGQPFVGPAGQLLDAMLAAIGRSRHAGADASAKADAQKQPVYIANVLKCRPPQNRNPRPEEVARCEPYLRRQVELLRPRLILILALGRFAVQSLLQTDEPIGRLRGRVHRYQGVPVIVTYHPAYLLRNPAEKAKAWQDLCLALQTAA